jgi:hypothetical protein
MTTSFLQIPPDPGEKFQLLPTAGSTDSQRPASGRHAFLLRFLAQDVVAAKVLAPADNDAAENPGRDMPQRSHVFFRQAIPSQLRWLMIDEGINTRIGVLNAPAGDAPTTPATENVTSIECP